MIGPHRPRGPRRGRATVRAGTSTSRIIEQEAPLGLAHAVMTAADFVRGQPFLMYLGDNVLLEGVTRFVEEFERTRPDAQIFVARVAEPEHFGVVELEGATRCRLVEKPREFVSDLALVGVYLFDDSILEACATPAALSWRGEYEITEAIQWLIDHGKTVRAEMVDGWWKDTGTPEDLLEANRMLLAARPGSTRGDGVRGRRRRGRARCAGVGLAADRPRRDRPRMPHRGVLDRARRVPGGRMHRDRQHDP